MELYAVISRSEPNGVGVAGIYSTLDKALDRVGGLLKFYLQQGGASAKWTDACSWMDAHGNITTVKKFELDKAQGL